MDQSAGIVALGPAAGHHRPWWRISSDRRRGRLRAELGTGSVSASWPIAIAPIGSYSSAVTRASCSSGPRWPPPHPVRGDPALDPVQGRNLGGNIGMDIDPDRRDGRHHLDVERCRGCSLAAPGMRIPLGTGDTDPGRSRSTRARCMVRSALPLRSPTPAKICRPRSACSTASACRCRRQRRSSRRLGAHERAVPSAARARASASRRRGRSQAAAGRSIHRWTTYATASDTATTTASAAQRFSLG